MRRKIEKENKGPMVKKFAKIRSLSFVLLLCFLGAFDFGFED